LSLNITSVYTASRKIFGRKRDEVTGMEKTKKNVEINDLYSSVNIIRMIQIKNEMGGACRMRDGVLVDRPDR
jgi:hypothetical protein